MNRHLIHRPNGTASVGSVPDGAPLGAAAARAFVSTLAADELRRIAYDILGWLSCSVANREAPARIAHELLRAIETGRISVHHQPLRALGASTIAAPTPGEVELAALGPEAAPDKTWFEVKVVDVYGKPVDGVDVVFTQGSLKEKAKTNGAGVAKWKDVEGGSFAKVALASPKDVRAALKERWGKSDPVDGLVGDKLSVLDEEIASSLSSETPKTLILVKPLKRVRLVGMHFDTNKCFLRATAMTGIRSVVQVYKKQPNGKLLVVGHTDTVADDAYNLDLSLERAEAIKAFLKDDVAHWEAWFGDGKPKQKRWGDLEVHEMIGALPCEPSTEGFQQWSNDARGTDLKVDGKAGPKTRKALIEAYMALDNTTLPKATGVEVHGCGEFFPVEDAGNNVESDANRRVEIYCFHEDITPPVPGPKASKGEPQYKQWEKQVTDDVDVSAAPYTEFMIRLADLEKHPLPNARCRVGGAPAIYTADDEGWVTLKAPQGAASVNLAWEPEDTPNDAKSRFFHRQSVSVPAELSDDDGDCAERLRNLGFAGADLGELVVHYQQYFALEVTALLDDIREDLIAWHDGGARPKAA